MGEWITTGEAARRLHVSPATIRRKIAAGELSAQREERPQGTRWMVRIDPDASPRLHVTPVPQTAVKRPDTSVTRDALAVALDEIVFLRRQLEEAQAAQSELRQLLAREQDITRQLRAGNGHHASGSARGTVQNSAHDTSQVTRQVMRPPWWRRLLQALASA